MKTEEDEAFDEIARKQGMWGGGFPAKRQMAADKVQDETDMLTIAYLDGYEKGKKAALAQPPSQRTWVGLTAQEAAECWTTNAVQIWENFEAKLKEKNNGT